MRSNQKYYVDVYQGGMLVKTVVRRPLLKIRVDDKFGYTYIVPLVRFNKQWREAKRFDELTLCLYI